MSAQALAPFDVVATWRSQRGVAIALGLGLVALALLFHEELVAAVGTWIDSTAYNHCFLVIPIAGYLAWDRRERLHGLSARPLPLVALGAIPLAIAWLLAERLGIMEGRQLMVVSFVELLILSVLGWRLCWVLCGPLLYLYFLVPFGAFLTPQLQDITTVFVRHGLDLLHIPAYIDGYTIEIPEGSFYIAEACAGLRFLIASIAFGCLYALLMYRSKWRRLFFIIASILVPIVANGIRAVGIVALGHLLGSAQAAATDHVLYGWIFFSLVILLLIALGLPFREDLPPPIAASRDGAAPTGAPSPVIAPQARAAFSPVIPAQPSAASSPVIPAQARAARLPVIARRASAEAISATPSRPAADAPWRAAALAVVAVLALASISPALAVQLDRGSGPDVATLPPLQFGPGCSELPSDTPLPIGLPGTLVMRRVACDGTAYDVRLDVLNARSTAGPVLAVAHRFAIVPNPTDDEELTIQSSWLRLPDGPPHLWRLTRTMRPGPMIAVAIWTNGQPAAGGLAMRIQLAWHSLRGGGLAPVILAVTPVLPATVSPDAAEHAEQRLAVMLARADLGPQIRRIGAAP
jgi:exosortase A